MVGSLSVVLGFLVAWLLGLGCAAMFFDDSLSILWLFQCGFDFSLSKSHFAFATTACGMICDLKR